MRAGVVCAGAIAVAAIATAVLIKVDIIGRASPAAGGAPQVAAASTASVRRIDGAPPSAPAALQPAQPAVDAANAAAQISAASSSDSIAPTRLVSTTVETTGSIAPTPKLYVNGSRVALRSAPDRSAKIVDRMSDGQKLIEMSRNGEWVRVRFANSNAEGWVNSTLVSASPQRK